MKQTNRTISVLLALLMIFSVATTAFAAGGNNALTLVSAKVGDADLQGAKISAGSEIVLTFSNNVTDASVLAGNIGRIQIKDSNNAAAVATVTPGTDKAVFIVTLGDLAKGSYTLTIGKEFAAKNGATLGSKTEIPFSVSKGDGTGTGGGNGSGNGESPLTVVSVTADGKDLANATVNANAAITITFDRGMTLYKENNLANITLVNANGEKVTAYSLSDFQREPKTEGVEHQNTFIVMTLNNLAPGEYTLKLGKDLMANNDHTLGKAVNITFTVKAEEDGHIDLIRSFFDTIANLIKQIIDFFKNIFTK